MRKIDTVFITYTFFPIEGGIQTYLKNIAEHWENGKVKIFTKKEENIPDLIREPLCIQRFSFGSKNYFYALVKILLLLFIKNDRIFKRIKFLFLLMCSRSALKIIANFTLDVVKDINLQGHIPNVIQCSLPIYTGLVGAILKLIYKGKLVIYIHGSELIKYEKMKNIMRLQKFVFDFADIIISNSNYTKEKAVSLGASSEKIKVVNLGADTDKFYPIDSKQEIYEKFNIPKAHKLLLTISHLVPRKGNDMVIKALPNVLRKHPNVTYLIGGRGKYKQELQSLIKDNKVEENVKFTGFIEENELNLLLNACDIFIMPNRQEGYDVEGYGIVFMEANACKKPVIGGKSGGVTDAIIDGENGLLVDPNSVDDISEKIVNLLNNEEKRKKMGSKGFCLVRDERNWDVVSSKIQSLIANI